jgi:PHP family Zn ribbon phosphoesterase
MEVWTIEVKNQDGGYSILNDQGDCMGSYSDAQCGRSHHAMALAENKKLRKALTLCLHVIEKGIEVRIGDQWPAIRKMMPEAVEAAKDVLYMPNPDRTR